MKISNSVTLCCLAHFNKKQVLSKNNLDFTLKSTFWLTLNFHAKIFYFSTFYKWKFQIIWGSLEWSLRLCQHFFSPSNWFWWAWLHFSAVEGESPVLHKTAQFSVNFSFSAFFFWKSAARIQKWWRHLFLPKNHSYFSDSYRFSWLKKLLRKPNESFFKVHHEEVILLRQVTKVINSIHIATFKNAEEEVQQHSLIHSWFTICQHSTRLFWYATVESQFCKDFWSAGKITLFEIFIFFPKIHLSFPVKIVNFLGEKLVKMLWFWTF